MRSTATMPSPTPALAAGPPGDGRPARPGLVRRDRLIVRLAATKESPVLLLAAPAGYGKTTILADWAEQETRPCAWLTLDERHNDPAVMLGAIAASLHTIEPIDDAIFAPLATHRSGISSVIVPRLCDVLRDRQPFLLVLDDLDLIENPGCFDPLATLVRFVPEGSQIALASRTEPPLPLGSLRADRRLAELGAGELAMTTREASATLAACGLVLREESVKQLVGRTEGWPAGIYLAALSLAGSDELEAAVEDFHGDDRLVADYFRDVFLSGVDPGTLEFLVRTSALDRLSGELCDAVLERKGSAALLQRLVRSNLLIVPLDGRDRTYRYHALLREMLRSELFRGDAVVASDLHRRASESKWLFFQCLLH